jgi:HJR/Mrr/RecB family endonuclease
VLTHTFLCPCIGAILSWLAVFYGPLVKYKDTWIQPASGLFLKSEGPMVKRRKKNAKLKTDFKVLLVDDDPNATEIMKNMEAAFPEVDLQWVVAHSFSELEKERVGSFVIYDAAMLDMDLSKDGRGIDIISELHTKAPNIHLFSYGSSKDPDRVQNLPFKPTLIKGPLKKGTHPVVLALRRAIKAKLRKQNLDQKVIVPIEQSIVVINRRLIKAFKDDTELLRTIDPILFEEVVANLFEEEGYKIILTPPRSDGGKDIYAYKTDLLTQVKYLVECKRYVPPHKVDVGVARQLYGVVQQEQASGGIIVTTSYFTQPARDFAKQVEYQLFLTDFDDLTQWFKRLG